MSSPCCDELYTWKVNFFFFLIVEKQMHRKHSVQSIVLGKDTFGVTVYPNVDYAFIVALVVILEEINEDRKDDD